MMDNINANATEHGDYQYRYDDLYRLTSVRNGRPLLHGPYLSYLMISLIAYTYQ
ncbi:MAG: hypothetical protein SV686_10070 [Thermodesulfobacteriota bacterium]|nr:hypothetical protein [Thermodesulfobacteriota bacterium]